MRAAVLYKLGKNAEAINDLTRAIELQARDEWYLNLSTIHISTDQYELAAQDAKQAIAMNSSNSDAHNYLGLANIGLNDLEQAMENFSTAIEMERHGAFYHNRGGILFQRGDFQSALLDFNSAVDLGYSDPNVYYLRALSLMYLGKYSLAQKDWELYFERSKELSYEVDISAYIYLAQSSTNALDHHKAIVDWAMVIALDPTYADAYVPKGHNEAALGLYSEAIQSYTEALALDPTLISVYKARGSVYLAAGDPQSALVDLEMYLQVSKGNITDAEEVKKFISGIRASYSDLK